MLDVIEHARVAEGQSLGAAERNRHHRLQRDLRDAARLVVARDREEGLGQRAIRDTAGTRGDVSQCGAERPLGIRELLGPDWQRSREAEGEAAAPALDDRQLQYLDVAEAATSHRRAGVVRHREADDVVHPEGLVRNDRAEDELVARSLHPVKIRRVVVVELQRQRRLGRIGGLACKLFVERLRERRLRAHRRRCERGCCHERKVPRLVARVAHAALLRFETPTSAKSATPLLRAGLTDVFVTGMLIR